MKAGNVGYAQTQYNQYKNTINDITNKITKNDKDSESISDNYAPSLVDTYTPSVEGAADPAMIDRLWKETNYAADAIRKLVQSMLGKDDASGQGFWAHRAEGGFKLSEADRAEAQAMIGEDGFFGVEKTAARIMDFAKALVGEGASEEQINKMRSAVQKGFDQVSKMFGGFDKLPSVTKETHESIMKSFDEWLGKLSGDASHEDESQEQE